MPVRKSLYWYHRPMLFTGESQGQHYFGLIIDETENDDVIFLSLCTAKRARDIEAGLVTPRQAQVFPDSRRLFEHESMTYASGHALTCWADIGDPSKWAYVERTDDNTFISGYNWWKHRSDVSRKQQSREAYKLRHKRARR